MITLMNTPPTIHMIMIMMRFTPTSTIMHMITNMTTFMNMKKSQVMQQESVFN